MDWEIELTRMIDKRLSYPFDSELNFKQHLIDTDQETMLNVAEPRYDCYTSVYNRVDLSIDLLVVTRLIDWASVLLAG